jgi:hypothetical protein
VIKVIDRVRYDTAAATLIASGPAEYPPTLDLYRTAGGRYFIVMNDSPGRETALMPVPADEAEQHYQDAARQLVAFEQAFPGVPVTEA